MTLRYPFWIVLVSALLCPLRVGAEAPPFPFTLGKPAGDGPFPAVVILHDCSGLGPRSSGMPWRWSSELTQRGYVTIWPDSFTPRGRPKGLCTDPTPPGITSEQRAADAYAALAYLASLPFVDARRIAVMGGSHGGSATLAAIVDTPANASRTNARFAAAIALYPACGRSYGTWFVERSNGRRGPITGYAGAFKPLAPLLILIGEVDDWTPAEPCRRLAEVAKSAGYPVEIKVYPGAHHSFDSILPVRYVAGRINRNAPTGRGATTGGNAGAWADAIDRVARFLAEHVR
jgi:dienelactone hydrolase